GPTEQDWQAAHDQIANPVDRPECRKTWPLSKHSRLQEQRDAFKMEPEIVEDEPHKCESGRHQGRPPRGCGGPEGAVGYMDQDERRNRVHRELSMQEAEYQQRTKCERLALEHPEDQHVQERFDAARTERLQKAARDGRRWHDERERRDKTEGGSQLEPVADA